MPRVAYEWERNIDSRVITGEIHRLKAEIKRISETTLRGVFKVESDREYWVQRLRELNGKLASMEAMIR